MWKVVKLILKSRAEKIGVLTKTFTLKGYKYQLTLYSQWRLVVLCNLKYLQPELSIWAQASPGIGRKWRLNMSSFTLKIGRFEANSDWQKTTISCRNFKPRLMTFKLLNWQKCINNNLLCMLYTYCVQILLILVAWLVHSKVLKQRCRNWVDERK